MTSLTMPPCDAPSYKSANFPMFKKLQCSCNPVLHAHVASHNGTVPLCFFRNCVDTSVMFGETMIKQKKLQKVINQKNTAIIPHLQCELESTNVSSQYKPAFKKHKHGEYHRTNYKFYCLESSNDKNIFYNFLDTLLMTQDIHDIPTIIYVLPCEKCYNLTEEEKLNHRSTLWNMIEKFESNECLNVSFFILVDHFNSFFDGSEESKVVEILQLPCDKQHVWKDMMGCAVDEFNLDYYKLQDMTGCVFHICLQLGLEVDKVLSIIQETLFKNF